MAATTTPALPTFLPATSCRCGGRIDFCCPQTRPFEAMRDRLQAAGYTPHHDKVDAEMIAKAPVVPLRVPRPDDLRRTAPSGLVPGLCPLPPLRPPLRVLSAGRTPPNACRMTTRKEFHP
jgi:hypothetical protein